MNRLHGMLLLALAGLLGAALPAGAQDDAVCLAVVETAVETAVPLCAGLKPGLLCYGSAPVTVEAQSGAEAITLEEPGDTLLVDMVGQVTLGALDAGAETWGIAVLRVQVDLPDDQAATLVLFGDVELIHEVPATPESGSASLLQPMQAFTLLSGVAETDCAGTVPGGVLIQTPADAEAMFLVNETIIYVAGTVFIHANEALTVSVIEGAARVKAFDVEREVSAGAQVSVSLGETGAAAEAPGQPTPYEAEALQNLPIALLEREITIAPPLAPVTCTLTALRNANLRGGPGTNYPIRGRLAEGETAVADGQAMGTDDLLWWRLEDATWVRTDLVDAPEDCADVAVVEAPEAPEAPAASGEAAVPPDVVYYVNACGVSSGTLQAGAVVQFFYGAGAFGSVAEAQGNIQGLTGAITLNDSPLPVSFAMLNWGENNYGVQIIGTWTAVSGEYNLSASMSLFGGVGQLCTLTVP